MKMILNRILLKVENIEKMLCNNKEGKRARLDESFLSKFPIENADGFSLVNTCILNDIDFTPKLVCWYFLPPISIIGNYINFYCRNILFNQLAGGT